MIKINLLPFRVAKKKEDVRRQISIYLLSVFLLLATMGYLYLNMNSRLAQLEGQKARKASEYNEYAGVNKKLGEIKQKLEDLRQRLRVIKSLEENKTGPVLLLDELARAVPRDRLWLSSLTDRSGILSLSGIAKDNDTVALFMSRLEKAPHIRQVDLESARLHSFPQHQLDLVEFTLRCRTYAYKEPEPAAQPAPGRGARPKR